MADMSIDDRHPLAPKRVAAEPRYDEHDGLPVGPRYWPRWMTVPTIAEYIDRTEWGIRILVKRGQIPFVKQGGTVYFDRLKIDEWMENSGRRNRRHRQSKAR